MERAHRPTTVFLIEDDAPLMRLMSWALRDDGFDVTVVSREGGLEHPPPHGA
jgi:DNA-binding response OmpR family regulator